MQAEFIGGASLHRLIWMVAEHAVPEARLCDVSFDSMYRTGHGMLQLAVPIQAQTTEQTCPTYLCWLNGHIGPPPLSTVTDVALEIGPTWYKERAAATPIVQSKHICP